MKHVSTRRVTLAFLFTAIFMSGAYALKVIYGNWSVSEFHEHLLATNLPLGLAWMLSMAGNIRDV